MYFSKKELELEPIAGILFYCYLLLSLFQRNYGMTALAVLCIPSVKSNPERLQSAAGHSGNKP